MPDSVITEALERFRISQADSADVRTEAEEDVKFARLGEQWDQGVKAQRQQEGRPCLTINDLPTYVRQVVNDGRQNSPAIQVSPVDNGADRATAEIIAGLIRSIERGSNAGVAYDTALEHAVDRGFGFFRITTDYAHPMSFDQVARIERVANPFSVHWDTSSTAFDASDWAYAFVSDLLSVPEYEARFGKKASKIDWEGAGEDASAWRGDEERIRVAEYWTRSEAEREIVQLSDGRVLAAEDLGKPIDVAPGQAIALKEALALSGITVARSRKACTHTVVRRTINGAEVLAEEDWPGTMIPICPVWGEEVIHQGRRYFRSLIRDARDPQRMFNFWRSATTELVALAPRAPFIVAAGQIPKGPEGDKWKSANSRSHAFLTYQPTNGAPAPQRQAFAGVPAGALQEALNASDDKKRVMGLYDASLGARSNETSGKAILARQREGDVSTFHFHDNLHRAIQYAGRVLVEIIPALYSEREAVEILGDDLKAKTVALSRERHDPQGGLYNVSVGRYDVAVKAGPSFTTQREETRAALVEMAQAAPQVAPILADVIVGTMDFPGADKVQERLKSMLPPQALAAEQQDEGGPPPEVAMMQQQMQQMQAALQQAQAEAQGKAGEAQVKAMEIQVKREELAFKREELAFKRDEMMVRANVEMARAQHGHAGALQPPAPAAPNGAAHPIPA